MRSVLSLLIAAASMAGCATLTVGSHIDRTVNFGEYITYDWGPPDNLPVGDPRLDNNSFFRDYLEGAVEKWLAFKGYGRAVSGQPDLLIHYHASVNQKVDVYESDQQYGYCYGDCADRIAEFEQGTLVVDVVDARTNKVIWRGWAQDTMTGVIDNQSRLQEQVTKNVAAMMAALPQGGNSYR